MDSSQRVRAIISFVHAVDAGSFVAAGRILGVTSAAISKNVAGLEKALGVRLLNRTTRMLMLTEEGAAFLRQARIALEALDAAVDTIAAQRATVSGRVRISTSSAFGRDHLLPALPALLTQYPDLLVEVDFDDRVIDMVRDGYDVAIRGGSIPDTALITRPICRMQAILVAAPQYLEHYGVPRTHLDLKMHRLIARRFLGGSVAQWSFNAPDGSITVLEPMDTASLTFSAPEALIQSACDGLGIAQIGVHSSLAHLRSGALKIVLQNSHLPGSYEMVMQYPHRALIAPRVKVTVEHFLSAFKNDERLHVPLESLTPYIA